VYLVENAANAENAASSDNVAEDNTTPVLVSPDSFYNRVMKHAWAENQDEIDGAVTPPRFGVPSGQRARQGGIRNKPLKEPIRNKPLKASAGGGVRFCDEPDLMVCERVQCGKSCSDAIFMWDDKMYCSESCRTLNKCATKKAAASTKVGLGFGRRRSQHCLMEMAAVCEDRPQ
jgi:hypothetical protein